MSACEFCTHAARGWCFGFQMLTCRGCQARAAARTPWFNESKRAGALTPDYRAMLQRTGLTHDEVKAAAEADRLLNPQPKEKE